VVNDFVEHENGAELGCATIRNIQAPQGWRDGRSVLTIHTKLRSTIKNLFPTATWRRNLWTMRWKSDLTKWLNWSLCTDRW